MRRDTGVGIQSLKLLCLVVVTMVNFMLEFHPPLLIATTYASIEGDALHSLRNNLIDPYKVLQSWDPTLVNPCMWFHITCDDHDSVIRVDLGNASLSGQLVPQLGELKKLQYLKLQSNNLSGPIPSNLGNLQNLVSLDLYFNHLSGSIPDTLGELSKLRFLRLNNNHLTGNIPISLTDVTKLQVLDLSNNLLSGHVPDNGSFSSLSFFSCANNLNLCGHATGKPCPLSSEFPPPFVAPPSVSSPGNRPSGTGVISGLVCGSVILFATVFGFAWWHWQKPEEYFFDVQNFPDEEYKELPPIKPKIFSLHVLQRATDGFNKNNIVGRGGFGTIYKGRLPDGSLVAVKRLKQEFTPGGVIQFMTEVDIRNRVRHPNVLPLVGFCVTPVERLLVFPYMTNKSVGDLLRGCKPTDTLLDWPTRKKIALGSAKGLFYLHDRCNPKIIHRDVKASNVMLDDKFEAILGDFGLAKSVDCDLPHVTTVVRGTIGHICPEYLSTGKVSNKTDVFGYGMMLLELITGQGAFDLRRLANDDDVMLLDWVKGHLEEKKWWKLVDPDLKANYIDSEVEQMIHLALQCTRLAPMERPDMSDVVTVLEDDGFEESWEEWLEARMIGGSDLEGEEESGSQRKGKGKEHEELQEGTSYSQEVEYAPDWNMDFNANLCSNEITECGHF